MSPRTSRHHGHMTARSAEGDAAPTPPAASTNGLQLLERIVTSTPNTVRAVAAIVVVIAVLGSTLWLLNADLTAGPVKVTGREHAADTSRR
ncbi:hypothetical protein [Amycolatopsis sp. A1MSW2902]|uniref:hypothetical protein n=1 Tax=Amycolatopsis sp. A1MSW2902 TaxID=687413 RepID=UPI00307D83D4